MTFVGRRQRRLNRGLRNPNDPKDIAQQVGEILDILDGAVGFGHPGEERNPGSATLPGDTASSHPGTIVHIEGTWVRKVVTSLNTAVTCYHNLGVPVAVSGEPNVLWFPQFKHDGNSADAASVVSVSFKEGDTVADNSIQLRFHAAGARVVSAGHPLKVTLFFIPAERWP